LRDNAPDGFARLHRTFVEHFGYAVIFAWSASVFAAWHAPWVHNIRGLIDPVGRVESTGSYLLALPIVMTIALALVAFGGDTLRRSQLFRNQHLEFGFAGLVAFAVFCAAIARAVTAFQLGH
jgi:hypothetical protein